MTVTRLYFVIVVLASGLMGFVIEIERLSLNVLHTSTKATDPLAQYSGFKPGQTMQALELLPCQGTLPLSIPQTHDTFTPTYCILHPPEGHFEQINLHIQSGSVVESDFFSRDLQLGDLVLYWGNPSEIQRIDQRSELRILWDTELYSIITTVGHYRPESWVRVLSLTTQQSEVDTSEET